MNLSVRPYKASDLANIEPRAYERELREKSGADYSQTYLQGYAYTVLDGDKPVMAGGVVELWSGVGEVWLFLSPWFEQHRIAGCRLICRLFDSVLKNYHFRRLQAPICASMPGNIRLVEFLGFEREGLLRRWGPDTLDYWMMSKISQNGEAVCLKHY